MLISLHSPISINVNKKNKKKLFLHICLFVFTVAEAAVNKSFSCTHPQLDFSAATGSLTYFCFLPVGKICVGVAICSGWNCSNTQTICQHWPFQYCQLLKPNLCSAANSTNDRLTLRTWVISAIEISDVSFYFLKGKYLKNNIIIVLLRISKIRVGQ